MTEIQQLIFVNTFSKKAENINFREQCQDYEIDPVRFPSDDFEKFSRFRVLKLERNQSCSQ